MSKEALRLVSAWAICLLEKSNLNDICHLTNFGVSDISLFGVKLVTMVVSFVPRDAEDLNVPFCPCLQLEC